jgi:hypothetical protein
MLKQIECRIVESRPLEPCRSLSNRQSDNCRQDRFSRPPRPDFREKTPADRPSFFAYNPKKPLATFNTIYPLGMVVDILA